MKSFSKKTWRRIFRVAIIVIGIYLLFMVGLSIYISSSKERLLKFLTERMKETILGELKIDNADITVWQSFPKIGIQLKCNYKRFFLSSPFLTASQLLLKLALLI